MSCLRHAGGIIALAVLCLSCGNSGKEDCENCGDGVECDSDNCREIECAGGDKAMVCLPDGWDENTDPADVADHCPAICN